MDEFIRIPIEVDQGALEDRAVTVLKAKWPDYVPNDGDQEVVMIEALAPLAVNAAEVAARVPVAIFRKFGTDLYGVAYAPGTAATSTATFTLADAVGHTILAGFEFDVDGWAFKTDVDLVVAPAATTGSVGITASEVGTDANDLPGDNVIPVTASTIVVGIALDAPTSGGLDPDDDQTVLPRIRRELQLQRKTLVTLRDFELMALDTGAIARARADFVAARDVKVTVAKADGSAASGGDKTALQDLYDVYQAANMTSVIANPDYDDVAVQTTVKALPGQDAVALHARVVEILQSALSPAVWGTPTGAGEAALQAWTGDNIVRHNKLIDIVGDDPGVDYVVSLTITGQAGSGDYTLLGTGVVLPLPGTMTVTVT